MSKTATMTLILAALTASASAFALDPTARGRELFQSSRLGTNGKSCATCHANGRGLEEVGAYDDSELVKVVNQCIRESLAGKPPGATSTDMKALLAYLRSFSNP